MHNNNTEISLKSCSTASISANMFSIMIEIILIVYLFFKKRKRKFALLSLFEFYTFVIRPFH